jgi:hypothetical protein
MLFIFNRRPFSQAGIQGFQPAKIDESLPAVDRIGRGSERLSTLDVAPSNREVGQGIR